MKRWMHMQAAACLVASLAWAGLAWGDCGKDHAKDTGTSAAQSSPNRMSMVVARFEYQPQLQRLSKIKGMPVTSRLGEDLGKIDNLAIDVINERVAYAVISSGGIMDLGDTESAIPFSALSGSAKADRLIADVTREQVRQSHERAEADLTKPGSEDWVIALHRHYGMTPYWHGHAMPAERAAVANEAERQSESIESEYQAVEERAGSRARMGSLVMVEEIMDHPVSNNEDQELGVLKDLMVDLSNGYIGYAVIARGGIIGIGEKLVAVPFDLARITGERNDRDMVCDLSKEQFKDAPAFQPDKWPDMTSVAWNEKVHQYYESEPYYVVYGYVIPEEQMERDIARGESHKVSGTIAEIDQEATGPGMEQPGVRIDLKIDADRMRTLMEAAKQRVGEQAKSGEMSGQQKLPVMLAPQQFLQKHDISLKQGDKVTVEGFVTIRDSKPCLVATSITKGEKSANLRDSNCKPAWSSSKSRSGQ